MQNNQTEVYHALRYDWAKENYDGLTTQAAKAVGVSENSASTVGHRLKNRLSDEIETEQF